MEFRVSLEINREVDEVVRGHGFGSIPFSRKSFVVVDAVIVQHVQEKLQTAKYRDKEEI